MKMKPFFFFMNNDYIHKQNSDPRSILKYWT